MLVSNKERRLGRSGVDFINFEQISHIALVFSLLTLKKVKADWVNEQSAKLALAERGAADT